MLINSATLGTVPLGMLPAFSTPEPVYVVRGQSFVWRLRLLVGGLDMSALLTGSADVDREEGAAGVAGFTLYLPPGPVVPTEWVGQSISIDYITRDRYGVVTEARLFTGALGLPTWDATTRTLACECNDQRQQRVEAMTVEQVDALVGGYWSQDVFDALQGRSRWDYAQERLSTIPASLDASPAGALRVTRWRAGTPDFVFGPGTTLDRSVQIELQELGAKTNRVEIDASYRFQRLWQHNQTFSWTHPETGGATGIAGFCNWRDWTSDLPTTDEIIDAVTAAGLTMVGRVGGNRLPLSMANPCGDGQPWTNVFDNLWLSFSATGARRWVQAVTESYPLVVVAPGGEEGGTPIVDRDSASFEIESSQADEWEGGSPGPGDVQQDLDNEPRRAAALQCLLHRGSTTVLAAHRGTTVSWQTPTDMVLGVDLVHTLQLDDKAKAAGKCRRIKHDFDLDGGTAITTLSVAISRGGGESDPLTVPPRPDTSLPPITGGGAVLATQLGGRVNDPITGLPIPPYDDERYGFSGNWDANDDASAEDFPHRFDVLAREIGEQYRDERTGTSAAVYRVSIPNDQLEL